MTCRHAPVNQFRRADAQPVHVARHVRQGQADAAGQESGLTQLPRCGLTATKPRCFHRELVSPRVAVVGGVAGDAVGPNVVGGDV